MKINEKNERAKIGDSFLLAELQQFSLAGIVAGQGENLPSSCWDSKVGALLVGNAK